MHENHPELFNLSMSAEAQPLLDAVKKHIAENVDRLAKSFMHCKRKRTIPGPGTHARRNYSITPNRRRGKRVFGIFSCQTLKLARG